MPELHPITLIDRKEKIDIWIDLVDKRCSRELTMRVIHFDNQYLY